MREIAGGRSVAVAVGVGSRWHVTYWCFYPHTLRYPVSPVCGILMSGIRGKKQMTTNFNCLEIFDIILSGNPKQYFLRPCHNCYILCHCICFFDTRYQQICFMQAFDGPLRQVAADEVVSTDARTVILCLWLFYIFFSSNTLGTDTARSADICVKKQTKTFLVSFDLRKKYSF